MRYFAKDILTSYPLELLGQIENRQILYCNLRSDKNWSDKISFPNWIAFTIANEEDKDLLHEMVTNCIDKGVCYTCSAGQLASLTEDYFDEETVDRQVRKEQATGESQDYEYSPMTTSHTNFDEGFWFAATNARQIINGKHTPSNQVVCIDCTEKKVRKHLINLIEKINHGWLPGDNEVENPAYDS